MSKIRVHPQGRFAFLETLPTVSTTAVSRKAIFRSLNRYACESRSLSIKSDHLAYFGSPDDGIITAVCSSKSKAGRNGFFEVSYCSGRELPKYLLSVSPQIGCLMGCRFCELGNKPFVRDLTPEEIFDQVTLILLAARKLLGESVTARKHKISTGRSGEALLNPRFPEALELLAALGFSFKICTVFPKSGFGNRQRDPQAVFRKIAEFAARYEQPVQVQVSLISTSEEYRRMIAGSGAASFDEIRQAADTWYEINPRGRKINLSLILSAETPAQAVEIQGVFPPTLFNLRLRPYLETDNGTRHTLSALSAETFSTIKAEFEDTGYTVLDTGKPSETTKRFRLASNRVLQSYKELVGEV